MEGYSYRLESVDLDGVLFRQLVGDEEGRHVFTLIPLQLQYFAQFLVFNNAPVAAILCT